MKEQGDVGVGECGGTVIAREVDIDGGGGFSRGGNFWFRRDVRVASVRRWMYAFRVEYMRWNSGFKSDQRSWQYYSVVFNGKSEGCEVRALWDSGQKVMINTGKRLEKGRCMVKKFTRFSRKKILRADVVCVSKKVENLGESPRKTLREGGKKCTHGVIL